MNSFEKAVLKVATALSETHTEDNLSPGDVMDMLSTCCPRHTMIQASQAVSSSVALCGLEPEQAGKFCTTLFTTYFAEHPEASQIH